MELDKKGLRGIKRITTGNKKGEGDEKSLSPFFFPGGRKGTKKGNITCLPSDTFRSPSNHQEGVHMDFFLDFQKTLTWKHMDEYERLGIVFISHLVKDALLYPTYQKRHIFFTNLGKPKQSLHYKQLMSKSNDAKRTIESDDLGKVMEFFGIEKLNPNRIRKYYNRVGGLL